MFPSFSLGDEWISMDSSRLRRIQAGSTPGQFKEGDRCLARWTDSRKFRATIQKVLENSKKLKQKTFLEFLFKL